jgi:hypothetical protein
MNRFQLKNKKLKLGLGLFFAVILIGISWGANNAQAQLNEGAVIFTPQVTIPGSDFQSQASTTLEANTGPIAKYISAVYNYGVGIVGILAALMLMLGGIIWLTAAGSSTKIEQAKSFISSSLTGMALVLTAYVLLNTINPELVSFKPVGIKNVEYAPLSISGFASKDALPKDTTLGTLCGIMEVSICDLVEPTAMITIESSVCKEKLGETEWNNRLMSCRYEGKTIYCCGSSLTDKNRQDSWCAGKAEGTACQTSMTGKVGSGYCENNKCVPCITYYTQRDAAGQQCTKSYQCKNILGTCGIKDGVNNGLESDGGCYKYGGGRYCGWSVEGTDCEANVGDGCWSANAFCCPGLCCSHVGTFATCIPGAQMGGTGSGSNSPDSCKY